MAVITTQSGGGGGLLGGLGSLFTLGSMLIPGAQWMAPLGMGMNAINGVATGNPASTIMSMAQMMNGGKWGNWKNPAAGNLYTPGGTKIPELPDPLEDRYV
jgi:hypothetical protein